MSGIFVNVYTHKIYKNDGLPLYSQLALPSVRQLTELAKNLEDNGWVGKLQAGRLGPLFSYWLRHLGRKVILGGPSEVALVF